jgi:anti-sigma B factor antagonist
MTETKINTSVRRLNGGLSIIDIRGDMTGFAEDALMAAYNQATNGKTQAVILNFTGLEYMNSSGIGLLVTLLIRAQRQKQQLLAYGLSDHYQQIFELTRLNEAIGIFADEPAARPRVTPRVGRTLWIALA